MIDAVWHVFVVIGDLLFKWGTIAGTFMSGSIKAI
jgi:hypothetical protein